MRVRNVVVRVHGITGNVLAGCEEQRIRKWVGWGRSSRGARSSVACRNREVQEP
jgi:hypothetical protein